MKIAVLAKDHQDFQDFIRGIYANSEAQKVFCYIQNMNSTRGVRFDAVIRTDLSYKRAENY